MLAAPQRARSSASRVGPRPGCRTDHVGTVGQGTGSHRIRFGQLARGPGTIAGLPRCTRLLGGLRRGPGTRHRALQAPSGLRAHSGWGGESAPSPRASPPRWHHWRRPGRSQRGAGQHPPGLWPHQSLQNRARHAYALCPPDLAHTGSLAPDNGTGSGSPERDDPATLRSRRTKATSVRTSRDCVMGMLPHHPLKDTRLEGVACTRLFAWNIWDVTFSLSMQMDYIGSSPTCWKAALKMDASTSVGCPCSMLLRKHLLSFFEYLSR